MTNDVLEHLKAIKREIAMVREAVDECTKYCDEQSKLNEQYREVIDTQAKKIRGLEVDIQILKDGGNI